MNNLFEFEIKYLIYSSLDLFFSEFDGRKVFQTLSIIYEQFCNYVEKYRADK